MNRKTFLASLAAAFVARKLPRIEVGPRAEATRRTLMREGLPKLTWRRLNEGVTPSKARIVTQVPMPPERRWFSLDD